MITLAKLYINKGTVESPNWVELGTISMARPELFLHALRDAFREATESLQKFLEACEKAFVGDRDDHIGREAIESIPELLEAYEKPFARDRDDQTGMNQEHNIHRPINESVNAQRERQRPLQLASSYG